MEELPQTIYATTFRYDEYYPEPTFERESPFSRAMSAAKTANDLRSRLARDRSRLAEVIDEQLAEEAGIANGDAGSRIVAIRAFKGARERLGDEVGRERMIADAEEEAAPFYSVVGSVIAQHVEIC